MASSWESSLPSHLLFSPSWLSGCLTAGVMGEQASQPSPVQPLLALWLFDCGSQVTGTCAGLCSGAPGAGGRECMCFVDSPWAGVCLPAAASSLTPVLLEAGAVCPSDLR